MPIKHQATHKGDLCLKLAMQMTARDPDAIPEHERSPVGGPLQRLLDHPIVVGFMNEFVAYEPLASEDGYGFRCEGSFLTIRPWGPEQQKIQPTRR